MLPLERLARDPIILLCLAPKHCAFRAPAKKFDHVVRRTTQRKRSTAAIAPHGLFIRSGENMLRVVGASLFWWSWAWPP